MTSAYHYFISVKLTEFIREFKMSDDDEPDSPLWLCNKAWKSLTAPRYG